MGFNTNKVKGLMAENNLTQSDVAKEINKTEMTLRNKLQGKTEFTANEVAILSDLFKVSPSIFFTNKFYYKENDNEKIA